MSGMQGTKSAAEPDPSSSSASSSSSSSSSSTSRVRSTHGVEGSGGGGGGGGLHARGVVPCAGAVLCFPQGNTASLLHEGSAVTRGTKLVIRSDVLYMK